MSDSFQIGHRLIAAGELKGNEYVADDTLLLFLFVQFHVAMLFILSSAGSKKNDRTGSLLLEAKCAMYTCGDDMRQQLEALATTIGCLQMDISAGFFTMDHCFFFTISTTVITYLVILLQFQSEYDGCHNATMNSTVA